MSQQKENGGGGDLEDKVNLLEGSGLSTSETI
jgi:hypothetical protein